MSEQTEVLDAVAEPAAPEAPESTAPTETVIGTRRRLRRPRRTRALALGIAAVLVLGGAGAAVASAHKTVQLDVDGRQVSVSTFAGDVGDLLQAQGVSVGEHDLVVPELDSALTEGSEIVVRTAEEIEVTIDGEATSIWTVSDTAAQALADLQASGRDAHITASRSSGRPALELPLVSDGPVTFAVDGAERIVQIDGVADLASALLAAEIETDADDRFSITAQADGSPVVTVTRIGTQDGSRTEQIPFETIEQGTDDLYEGQERVVSEGSEGVLTYTYVSRLVDGEIVSSRLVSAVVTTEPVDRVVEHGTAERPVVTTSSSSSSSSSSSGSSGGGTVSGDVWAALAQCESGGNPSTNTGNGYYGLYQFSLGTWQSVGGSGLPSDASAAEQTERAQILQARSGWGQWPHCSSKLGLR